MDISKIQSFIAVAGCGSFTKAADELFLAQSTVSKHIISLEKELGIKLFYRHGMNYFLTTEGKKMLRYYSELMDIWNRSNEAVEEMKKRDLLKRDLSIVGGSNMYQYGIICALTSFMKEQPDIRLNIDDASSSNMQYALLSGDYELAFCLDSILDERTYSWQFYYRDELAACVCNDSPYRDKTIFYAHDLTGKKLIAGSVGKGILMNRADEAHRKLDFVFDTVNPAIAIELLLINPECIFVAPKKVLDRYPGSLTRQIPVKGLGDCSWVFAWKKKAQLSGLAKEYLAFMRKYSPEMFIAEAMDRRREITKYMQS